MWTTPSVDRLSEVILENAGKWFNECFLPMAQRVSTGASPRNWMFNLAHTESNHIGFMAKMSVLEAHGCKVEYLQKNRTRISWGQYSDDCPASKQVKALWDDYEMASRAQVDRVLGHAEQAKAEGDLAVMVEMAFFEPTELSYLAIDILRDKGYSYDYQAKMLTW